MMTETPQIKVRKLVAQWQAGGWFLTMDETGMTAEFPSADRVVRHIQHRDGMAAKRGNSTATLIDWIDVPDGFVPPEIES